MEKLGSHGHRALVTGVLRAGKEPDIGLPRQNQKPLVCSLVSGGQAKAVQAGLMLFHPLLSCGCTLPPFFPIVEWQVPQPGVNLYFCVHSHGELDGRPGL